MNLDAIALECFIHVAETGSFTKTGERLYRTQSAISQQIAKLESHLGKPLFIRGKKLSLTAEGEIFLGYAKKIFTLQRETIDRFKQPELEGEVRFGLPEDFASVFLSEVLSDFRRIHPRILLKIECDLTLNLFERFKQNEFDLVLVKMNCPKAFPHGQEVWSEGLRWIGDQSLIQSQKPIPLVLSPAPCVYRASAIKALEDVGRPWRLAFSSPSHAGIMAAVRAGMGIAIVPHMMIPDDIETIKSPLLPKLSDTHVSLIKYQETSPSINSLAEFVMRKMRR